MARARRSKTTLMERAANVAVHREDALPEMHVRVQNEMWGMGHIRVYLSRTTWEIVHCDSKTLVRFYPDMEALPEGEHRLDGPDYKRALGRYNWELPNEEDEAETRRLLRDIRRLMRA